MNYLYSDIPAKSSKVVAAKQVYKVKYTANSPYSNYKALQNWCFA
jgi:hypothetical protein